MTDRRLQGLGELDIRSRYSPDARVTLHLGDRLELLEQIGDGEAQLVVTSPPYNIGKEYEERKRLDEYLQQEAETIAACTRVLAPTGSICWEVGNHIGADGQVLPLDILLYPAFASLGLRLRNRIVWQFGHGLHCKRRFSGRHEAILWFTKSDEYVFELDRIRVPQKYPGKKHYKGGKAGRYSGNPLGKNPGDVWDIPNVKANHVEKTIHPCQFPVELVERLVLSMTNPGDLVVDPYIGVGTAAVAALLHGRRAAGADIVPEYIAVAKERLELAAAGALRVRPMHRPVYEPSTSTSQARRPEEWGEAERHPGGQDL